MPVSSQRSPLPADRLGGLVQHPVVDAECLTDGTGIAADERQQARQQFLFPEGFGEVIVRALLQALHLLLPGIARREDQHRRLHPVPAPVGQHVEARAFGQTEIEYDHVIGGLTTAEFRLHAVGAAVDGEPLPAEVTPQARTEFGVILGQQ